MVYVFRITSEEKEDFIIEVKIKSDQTFLKFHNVIQECVGYDASQIASFYSIDSHGDREKEVALFEMSSEEEELDVMVMDVTMIRELVDEKHKELLYLYDFFSDRYFNIELLTTEKEKSDVSYPLCSLVSGEAPKQILLDEIEMFKGNSKSFAFEDKDLYGEFMDDDDEDDDVQFENLDDYTDIL